MVRHVVLFRWIDGATDEQLQAVVDGLAELRAAIAEIADYRYGPDLGVDDGTADFAVVADFATVADYETYRDHPAHRDFIARCIAPIRRERMAVQLEI
ncbi:MAG: Dabb family protein [Acidimicrobiales bacterium]